jgi:hypothetical protein
VPNVKCPICGETTDTDRRGFYCDGCGEKLPPVAASSEPDTGTKRDEPFLSKSADRPDLGRWRGSDEDYPRFGGSAEEDYLSNRPREGRSEEFKQAAKQVAGVLFVVAILQLICGPIVLFAMPEVIGAKDMPPEVLAITAAFMVAVCALFAGLGVWALYMPVPAGVVGLIAYGGLALMDIAAAPEVGFRGIILKVIIVVILIRGIIAASKAR